MSSRYPFYTRYTYHHHLRAEILNNVFLGVFELNELIAKKTLGASNFQIALLHNFATASFFLALIWGMFMEGRSKRPWFLLAGLFGRGILLTVAAVTSPTAFIIICFICFMSHSIYNPASLSLFRANYPDHLRGQVFGRVGRSARLLMIPAALIAAWILDQREGAYRVLFPIAGCIGAIAYVWYGSIRIRGIRKEMANHGVQIRRNPLQFFFKTLKESPTFLRYELWFFIYGIAFMMLLQPNNAILTEHAAFNYREATTAKTVLFHLMFGLSMPIAGWITDRLGTVRATGWFFISLSMYPLVMLAGWYLCTRSAGDPDSQMLFSLGRGCVYAAYAMWGMAMGGVAISWNLGATAFAGSSDPSRFQAVHVACVGIRGAFAPLLGFYISTMSSLATAYITATILFLIGSIGMFRLSRQIRAATA